MGRIRYGIKNVYYATATDDGTGKLTYATPVALPGAKKISLEAQGDSTDEYADNTKWYHEDANNGYSGDLEFEDTAAADDFLVTVLGMTKDTTGGGILEKSTDKPVEFALAFQFELSGSEESGKRTWLYRCTASRPKVEGDTKENGISVATNTVTITVLPRINDDAVKYSCDSRGQNYSSWFAEVVEVGAAG